MEDYTILSDLCFFYSKIAYSATNKVEIRVYRNNTKEDIFDITINPPLQRFTLRFKDTSLDIDKLNEYCSFALGIICEYYKAAEENGIEKYWAEEKLNPLIDLLNQQQYKYYLQEIRSLINPNYNSHEEETLQEETLQEERQEVKIKASEQDVQEERE